MTDVGPYTRVHCPGCQEQVRVKTEVESYHLVRRLAYGGMSVLYVAQDPTLDREVAVKVLNEDYFSNQTRQLQFEQEALLMATVTHPNVVRVFKVGRAFGRFYIAMELVTGQSLEERITEKERLSEKETLALALQIVDGLQATQVAGMIHRDIKPGNILIDNSGTAKILDFGLSLRVDEGVALAEEIWASPHYVSPEALEAIEEDHRSDIYALGATLYHALAGRAPLDADEMPTAQLREAKRTISSLKEVAPWLNGETARAVDKAMDYNRLRRFQTYDEFRKALEGALGLLKSKGQSAPVEQEVRQQRRERQAAHRKGWVKGVVIGLAALVVIGFLVLQFGENEEEPKLPQIVAPGADETLDPEVAMQINAAYEEARGALEDGNFDEAEGRFLSVWENEACPPPTAAWAGFEAAIVCMIDGRSGDARDHLVKLYDFLLDEAQMETQLGRRLQPSIEALVDLSFVRDDELPENLEDPFRATTLFAYALKSWEQGRLEEAADRFVSFHEGGPWLEAEWMEAYLTQADNYLEDWKTLHELDHQIAGKDRVALEDCLAGLEEAYEKLQTRGRAPYNVKAWQSKVVQRLRELGARRVSAEWKEYRSRLTREFVRAGRFTLGASWLEGLSLGGDLERRQRAVLRQYCKFAGELQEELRKVLAPGAAEIELRSRNDVIFTTILGSREGGILVEERGRTRELTWGEVAPGSVLELHRHLREVTTGADLLEKRLRQAIAYAWLQGEQATADALAVELGEQGTSFAEEWRRVTALFRE